MYRYAVIKDGKVTSAIIWDGVSPWKPPEGHTLLRSDICDRDDEYDEATQSFKKNNGIWYHKDVSSHDYHHAIEPGRLTKEIT